MGHASLVNGIVAAVVGVVANWVVSQTESFRTPFLLSALLLILAFFVIGMNWDENYGTDTTGGTVAAAGGEFTKIGQALNLVRLGKIC